MDEYTEDQIYHSCEIGRWVKKRQDAEDVIAVEVQLARKAGMSWAKIGLALGVSAQSAWERYGLTVRQRNELALAAAALFTQPSLEGLEACKENHPAGKVKRRKPRSSHET